MVRELIESGAGREYDLYAKTINPQFVRVLRTIGFDRRWLRGGAVQHHLIDARTGRPTSSRWSEVTVTGPTCFEADVAAKAAFLLSDDGPSWLDERGLAGRFLAADVAVTNRAWRESVREAA